MKNPHKITALLFQVIVYALPTILAAQSGQSPTGSKASGSREVPAQATPGTKPLAQVKFITAYGFDAFVESLNEHGKSGYRLDKSLNYGGEGPTQSYAAVLRLDGSNKYEYDWLSSPDKKLLESRLNYQAKKGFNFVNAYALTVCSGGSSEDEANPTSPESLVFRLKKGDAFLLERKNGSPEQTAAYKVFIAKVHLGDKAEKTIQAALDGVTQQGFRPIKILFARQGLLDFSVSVLVEKSLSGGSSSNIEYRFLKKTAGSIPKEVNALAAQGFRILTGRRIGMLGMVLLGKQASDAAVYTFIDANKFAKEFDKTVAGNSFQAVMVGDLTCDSWKAEGERLVFTQNAQSEKHDYKVLNLSNAKAGAEPLAEFQRLLSEGYRVKDLVYLDDVSMILEK